MGLTVDHNVNEIWCEHIFGVLFLNFCVNHKTHTHSLENVLKSIEYMFSSKKSTLRGIPTHPRFLPVVLSCTQIYHLLNFSGCFFLQSLKIEWRQPGNLDHKDFPELIFSCRGIGGRAQLLCAGGKNDVSYSFVIYLPVYNIHQWEM